MFRVAIVLSAFLLVAVSAKDQIIGNCGPNDSILRTEVIDVSPSIIPTQHYAKLVYPGKVRPSEIFLC